MMDQRDRAVAFSRTVLEMLDEGRDNAVTMPMDELLEKLQLEKFSPFPNIMRNVFKEYHVYVKKKRGRNAVGVWWQNQTAHGRGVSRRKK